MNNIEQEINDFEMFKKNRKEIINKLVNNENELKGRVKQLQQEIKKSKEESYDLYIDLKNKQKEKHKIEFELNNIKNFHESQIKNNHVNIISELEEKYDNLIKNSEKEFKNFMKTLEEKHNNKILEKEKLIKTFDNELIKIKKSNEEKLKKEKIRNKRKKLRDNKINNIYNNKSVQVNVLNNNNNKNYVNKNIQTNDINLTTRHIQTDIIEQIKEKKVNNDIPINLVKKGDGYITVYNRRMNNKRNKNKGNYIHPIDLVDKKFIKIKGVLSSSFKIILLSNSNTLFSRKKLIIEYNILTNKSNNEIVIRDEFGKSLFYKHSNNLIKLTKSNFSFIIENDYITINIDNKKLFKFEIWKGHDNIDISNIDGIMGSLSLISYKIKIE